MQSVLSGIDAGDVSMTPFPHLVVQNCLPSSDYAALAAAYPSDAQVLQWNAARQNGRNGRPGRVKANQRHNLGAHQIIGRDRVAPVWEDFVRLHASPAFFREVVAVFGAAARAVHPGLEDRIGALDGLRTGVRHTGDGRGAVALDCQIAINTPVTRPGSVRRVHTDAPDKLFVMLLYFRRDEDDSAGGDLEIWRWKAGQRPAFVGSQACERRAERVATIPYRANTLVAFVNSEQSLHAVSDRSVTPHSRRLVNIIGDVEGILPGGLFVKRQQPFGRLRRRLRTLLQPR